MPFISLARKTPKRFPSQVMSEQAASVAEHLRAVVAKASLHCRRDYLWKCLTCRHKASDDTSAGTREYVVGVTARQSCGSFTTGPALRLRSVCLLHPEKAVPRFLPIGVTEVSEPMPAAAGGAAAAVAEVSKTHPATGCFPA